jgi:hypothetical protein
VTDPHKNAVPLHTIGSPSMTARAALPLVLATAMMPSGIAPIHAADDWRAKRRPARELRELAARAANGDAPPGSRAAQQIAEAEKAGRFGEARALRFAVTKLAPALYAEAERVEQEDAIRQADASRRRQSDAVHKLRAEQKREQRKAKRRPNANAAPERHRPDAALATAVPGDSDERPPYHARHVLET